ncbi:hypothetical protein ACLB2K_008915 [Fragaria x ananassa]
MEGRVNLPPKIMLDIFSRLPVNHLCRWIYSLNLDQLLNENPNVDASGLVAAAPTELDFVYNHLRHLARYWFPFVHGPCNGLFLSQLYFGDFGYSLVNPATKESKRLPKIPIWRRPMKPFSLQLYGLGFDDSTNEYKIDYLFPYKALGYDGIVVNGAVHCLMTLRDLTTSRLEVDEEPAIWQLDDSSGFDNF